MQSNSIRHNLNDRAGEVLGVPLKNMTRSHIYSTIDRYLQSPSGCMHVVSLNPEILVEATRNDAFKDCLKAAEVQLCDGSGVLLACRFRGINSVEKLSGVDFVADFLERYSNTGLTILFAGGSEGVAEHIAECYRHKYPNHVIQGVNGIKDIKKDHNRIEESELVASVRSYKPQVLFLSYGSPFQELLIERNRAAFEGIVCAGVGGAFDFLSGRVPRAPRVVRALHLEWLFRLLVQPWRWRRQVQLLTFIWKVTNGL